MSGEYLEGLNGGSRPEAFLAGLTHAVQAIASVVLDDDLKREKLAVLLHELSEAALHAKLDQPIRQSYLDGLSSCGIASAVSKKL